MFSHVRSRNTLQQRAIRRPSSLARRLFLEQLEHRWLLSTVAGASSNAASDQLPYAPGEIIVGFEGNVTASFQKWGKASALIAANDVVHGLGLDNGRVLMQTPAAVPGKARLSTHWQLPAGADVLEICRRLSSRAGVAYAEPNYLYSLDATSPMDPRYDELWGLNNTGQTGGTEDADIDAPEAWDVTRGSSSIVVGVIDTGVDYTHEDLAANMWTNPGEAGALADNGVDDDGNGFIDDVYGWDFANDDNDPFDDNGHGSHTSGTIAAVGNNNTGVTGVGWNTQIMALKFLNAGGGGSTTDAIDAVNYATMMRTQFDSSGGQFGANVVLTSNSWGGGSESQALRDAIAASGAANMMFVASAGNNGRDADANPSYPAAYDLDNILSVAATDHNDERASFSNWGATSVDLAAPGVNVLSTTPHNTYSTYSGTSMAAPHVSGAAALAWSIAPDVSYEIVRDAILSGVDKIASVDPGQESTTPVATGGRLNAFGMLTQLGMVASPSNPAAGSVFVSEQEPWEFEITFSYDVNNQTLRADGTSMSDLSVNGVWADDGFVWHSDDPRKVIYRFASSPISGQGEQTMYMPPGAVETTETTPAGSSLREMNATFRYDAVLMEVTNTTLMSPSLEPLVVPYTLIDPLVLQVDFNEPYQQGSWGVDDLILSDGVVTQAEDVVTQVGDIDIYSVRYTIEGITQEGVLSVEMRAGAVTDAYGNPMKAFAAEFDLDWDTTDYPTPLHAVKPPGSLIYDPSISGFISYVGDNDTFQIVVDPGQKITAIVHPDADLAPSVTLSGPGVSDVTVTSPVGQTAIIQPNELTDGGTYEITVAGSVNEGGTGAYTLQLILNAAMEEESNDELSQSQDISGSFIPLTDTTSRGAVIGGIEDNGCTLPSGGYEACAYAPGAEHSGLEIDGEGQIQFVRDIQGTGNPILLGVDDDEVMIRSKGLGGFAFPLFDATYDQIIIGSNGQLTFEWERRYGGIVNNSPSNNDLTDRPTVATIAPFWDDLDITPETSAAVYWEVIGDQLIVQWDHVRFLEGRELDDISFQAVLDASDGTIQFNYKDLATDYLSAEGNSATVGIKNAGVQGDNRLLLAFNDGPNRFVGTGVSTTIAPVGFGLSEPVTPDYYTFQLLESQPLTLALEHSGGNAHLELHTPSGSVVSGIAGAANVDEVIELSDAPAGIYHAIISGDTRVDYNLLVTRGATFDVENNSGPEPWNGVDPFQIVALSSDSGSDTSSATVLGRIGGASSGDAVVGYYTDYSTSNTGPEGPILQAGFLPLQITDIATFDFNTIDMLMFDESNNNGLSDEVSNRLDDIQVWVEEGGVFLVHDRFVSNDAGDPQSNPFLLGASNILVDRDFANGADLDVIAPGDTLVTDGPFGRIDNTTLDGGNSSNHGFVVGDTLSTAPGETTSILSAGPDPSRVAAFSYPLGSGHVYYSTIPLDFYLGGTNNFRDPYTPNMLAYGYSLVQPEADFFQVQIPDLEFGGQFLLATSLPGVGDGEPVNGLDPMVRVYDATGSLLATDDNSGSGRNADLAFALAASQGPATYYVEVIPSNAPMVPTTQGPYVLKMTLTPGEPPAGITVNKTSIVTGEPDQIDTFTVVLNAQPTGNVTMPISTSNSAEAMLSTLDQGPAVEVNLTFDAFNWSTPQTVTVHGQNDDVDDGNQMYSVDINIIAPDDNDYAVLDPDDLTAINIDDDTAGISVLPTEGLVTSEAGDQAAFEVVLNSQPTAGVTITLTSSDPSEGTIEGATEGLLTLTFTDENWSKPQTVTITGQPDDDLDLGVPYTIITAPAISADGKYHEFDAEDVSVVNTDDEPATFVTIEDFEDQDLIEYSGDTSAQVSRKAQHDGRFGLQDVAEWMYRDDALVQPGDIISWWTRIAPREAVDGRAYMGFGATANGTYSIVMAPNAGSLLLQKNIGYGYQNLASVEQTWEANRWYRFEVAWQSTGIIIGRLYDSDGTTLLNTVVGDDSTDPMTEPGGLAFRAFGSLKQFDTVQVVALAGAGSTGRGVGSTSFTQPTTLLTGAGLGPMTLTSSTQVGTEDVANGDHDARPSLGSGLYSGIRIGLQQAPSRRPTFVKEHAAPSHEELIDLALATWTTEFLESALIDDLGMSQK